jgi:hypothetical protein
LVEEYLNLKNFSEGIEQANWKIAQKEKGAGCQPLIR